jgi:hypothetical protein
MSTKVLFRLRLFYRRQAARLQNGYHSLLSTCMAPFYSHLARLLYLRFPLNKDVNLVRPDSKNLNFRVVSIKAGSFDDPVECFLEIATIKKEVATMDYRALSYTWGSKHTSRVKIFINGLPFLVTQNLFLALRRLRDLKYTQPFYIDAICINQNDNAEKNVQVRHMSNIFTHAREVIVFLGEKTEHTDIAVKWIQKLGTWLMEDLHHTPLPCSELQQQEYTRAWLGLEDLLSRPWWTYVKCRQVPIINAHYLIGACG